MPICNEYKCYKTTKEAKEALGVKADTLRRWADSGLFPSIRTPGGQRLYNIQQYIEHRKNNFEEERTSNVEKQKICYCRVSSNNQKDDLERQIAYMSEKYPQHRIISDIGSGINFKRKGFRTMLELACKGHIEEIVVAYRDRMCRFAFELVEWILQTNGVKLVVLHKNLESSGQSELAEDLLSIINVFNCRVNGKRKYKKEKNTEETTTKCSKESTIIP
jgi:predicted site-specific integrase-resolvase